MPALTISTDKGASQPQQQQQQQQPQPQEEQASLDRPPISPITPPLNPLHPDPHRQTFTHLSHTDQTGITVPPPKPIDFDANPDVIALKSAISVLQVQKKRATEDIQRLNSARLEAVSHPEAFVKDLTEGKVRHGDRPSRPLGSNVDEKDDGEDEEETEKVKKNREHGGNDTQTQESQPAQQRTWHSLPTAQDVIRTPPINWSRYAVVGDSLDRLHKEQLSQPPQGDGPATYTAKGTYEFKGTGAGAAQQREPYRGVAAPYVPGKDHIDKKPKAKKT